MLSRLALLLITLFWVTMTVLLWRSEFGGRNHLGSTVPVTVVWQKILTAPDSSSMVISHHGEKIGFCRWAAILGQNAASPGATASDMPPEGMVEKPSDYRIEFEGNAVMGGMANQLRFNFGAGQQPSQGTSHSSMEYIPLIDPTQVNVFKANSFSCHFRPGNASAAG